MDNITTGIPPEEYLKQPLNVWGLVSLVIFYLIILLIGIWSSFKKKSLQSRDITEVMLAGRSIGPLVGILTMTATWVGGGFINGTAESVYSPGKGLAQTQTMWGYTLSLVIAGIFFAKPMREAGYVTMLDPFAARYGDVTAALIYIPAVMGDLFWSGAILAALGATLQVILALSREASIIISTAVAALYTVLGGLYSVVFTDIVQIFCIMIGLWIGVGFAMAHPAVSNISQTAFGADGWIGVLPLDPYVGNWIDLALLIILGGVPWQVIFQRMLSATTPRAAQTLTLVGAFGCIFLSIPAVLIGAIAKSTDWNATDYRLYWKVPIEEEHYPQILPLVFQYLTPPVVSIIGLGAVSAAVMSSADSSLLSSSSMFAWNVYRPMRKRLILTSKTVTDVEILWALRAAVVVLGSIAAIIAIKVNSIYALFVLCSDFSYVVAFPQLVCVVYLKFANTYGALVGYFVSFFFRLTAGEPLLEFDPLIKYWYYDESNKVQCFPYRTFAMLIGLLCIIIVSALTNRYLPERFDYLNAVYGTKEEGGNGEEKVKCESNVGEFSKEQKQNGINGMVNDNDNLAFIKESNGTPVITKATSI